MHQLSKIIVAFIMATLLSSVLVTSISAQQDFTDLDDRHWGHKYITDLVNIDILRGFGDGTFRPNEPVIRAHSALMVARSLDADLNAVTTVHDFKDVQRELDGYSAIQYLTEQDVFVAADHFHPSRDLTRGEMAKIISEAFELTGNTDSTFSDIDGHWSESYIETLIASDITEGFPDGTFRPDTSVSRAELSAFIQRGMAQTGTEFPDLQVSYHEEIVLGILHHTNEARKAEGIKPLTRHRALEEVAMVKAEDFVVNDYFAHTSPEYGSFGNMIRDFGVSYSYGGENLAGNYYSVENVVNAWMNSQGHRKNILNERFTHLGVGYYEHKGRTYYVQMFIQP